MQMESYHFELSLICNLFILSLLHHTKVVGIYLASD